MKGIYVLTSSPTSEDLYWICRARAQFEDVTVAFSLPAGKFGKDYHNDIMRVKKTLNHSAGLAVDFFEEGGLEDFLKRTSIQTVPVFTGGLFDSITEKPIETSLIIPGNNSSAYSSVDFSKYFFNLDSQEY